MITMQRGYKAKLDDVINTGETVSVEIAIDGNAEYDYSCFGLVKEDRLYNEDYFIFFNNPKSPGNEIGMSQNSGKTVFTVNLKNLPANVQKLAFTINIDAEAQGVMGDIKSCTVKINQNNLTAYQLDLKGSDFQKQKAIIALEIYKKDVWRVSAVANGFNGGLKELLRHYDPDGKIAIEPSEPRPKKETPLQTEKKDKAQELTTSDPKPEVVAQVSSVPRPMPDDEDYFKPEPGDWI